MSGSEARQGAGIGLPLTAFALVAAFFLYEFVARILPSLAIDGIAGDLGLTNARFGTVSSVFFWVYAPMQLVVGALLDRYGARRLVVPACAICSGGVLLFGMSDAVPLVLLGRFLTGLGASFAFVSALFVVTHRFPPERFALLSGVVNMIGMIGAAVGAVLLTDAMTVIGWRAAFLWTGLAGLGLAVAMLVLLPRDGTPAPRLRGPLVAGFGAIFVDTRLWLIALAGALYYMPINVFGGLWGQGELTADHGLSPVSAEVVVSMVFWGMALGSVAAGAIADRTGHRRLLVAGGATLAALCFGAAIYGTTGSAMLLGALLFLGGVFCGAQVLTFAMAREGTDAGNAGKIIAFVNMVGIASAVIFQPLIGEILDLSDGSYRISMATIPACLIGAAALMAMGGRGARP
ncbi:MFS transporter [Jannaschia sp. KMU-145]|uniref:MFS transporter n=1 Tax=Jannaschia halovivens TaxID=3388667 RepID=UPI00396B1A52